MLTTFLLFLLLQPPADKGSQAVARMRGRR